MNSNHGNLTSQAANGWNMYLYYTKYSFDDKRAVDGISIYSVGDIIDTWVYRGTIQGQFSLATAAGIFKGIIGMTLLFISNWASRKFTESSLF